MPVKIRLARRGRKKAPFYHIVAADARSPRDGKFIEKIGSYNPMTKPATVQLDVDKAYDWLTKGAQPTDTARALLRFKGVLYKKHLQRGVAKGALTQEAADAKLKEFIDAKDQKVAARVEQTKQERLDFLTMVSGSAKPKAKIVETDTDAGEAFRENAEEVAEVVNEAPEAEAEATEAEAPVVEAPEAAAEETPAEDAPAEDA